MAPLPSGGPRNSRSFSLSNLTNEAVFYTSEMRVGGIRLPRPAERETLVSTVCLVQIRTMSTARQPPLPNMGVCARRSWLTRTTLPAVETKGKFLADYCAFAIQAGEHCLPNALTVEVEKLLFCPRPHASHPRSPLSGDGVEVKPILP